MKTFIDYCATTKKELPVYAQDESGAHRRGGIAHWAYPDAYVRSQYPALYFTPIAADALVKMGPKVDEKKVDRKG